MQHSCTYMHLSRVVLVITPETRLIMNKNFITYFILCLAILALGGSIKMLNAGDTLAMDAMEMPAPVSLNVNDLHFSVSEQQQTKSQYCSKDASFTFFFATEFPNAFTLRMVVDSEDPFKLNHRYEIPLEEGGMSLAGLQNYAFGKDDDYATAGWIEFTAFEKEGGILTREGEVRCAIEGRFGFTVAGTGSQPIEVTGGTFRIPEAQYCDLRTTK